MIKSRTTAWGASCILLLAVAVHQLHAVAPATKPVTNEDIRDAIISILHMMRGLEDKLDRHEFRERALGQDLKKNFATLDKRIKGLESIKGTTQRLDQRVANVETVLMEKDGRERAQLQTTYDTVTEMKKRLFDDMDKLRSHIDDKLSNVSTSAAIIQDNFQKLASDNDVLKKANAASIESIERTKKQLSSSELLLQQYEHKLVEFNDKIHTEIVPMDYKDDNLNKLVQENHVLLNKVVGDLDDLSRRVNNLPDKQMHTLLTNNMSRLEALTKEQPEVITAQLSNATDELRAQQSVITAMLDEMKNETANGVQDLLDNQKDVQDEMKSLAKVEEVIVHTAEDLLDTKRRVEYAVHEIKLEVDHLIKEHGEKMNDTIHERFDAFEASILDGETGALANLTAKIGQDIDQVWRQIGIMHQQMSASTDTLNKLQNQTDIYVNGSLNVMDNMKSKVSQITSRMNEVDENLNHLMGRLLLVNQEFNKIKGGLVKALDSLRANFSAINGRISSTTPPAADNPGPHKIPDSTEDTHAN